MLHAGYYSGLWTSGMAGHVSTRGHCCYYVCTSGLTLEEPSPAHQGASLILRATPSCCMQPISLEQNLDRWELP